MESGIGTAINIELATLPNFTCANGITLPVDFHTVNVLDSEIEFSSRGKLSPNQQRYIGYGINEELIEKLALSKKTVDKSG